MAISTSNILEVLASYGVSPIEDDPGDIDFPEVGEIREGETVYLCGTTCRRTPVVSTNERRSRLGHFQQGIGGSFNQALRLPASDGRKRLAHQTEETRGPDDHLTGQPPRPLAWCSEACTRSPRGLSNIAHSRIPRRKARLYACTCFYLLTGLSGRVTPCGGRPGGQFVAYLINVSLESSLILAMSPQTVFI